ncbi:uncharacterized protein LOC132043904 [Lycium ferocissimum]|uniref:uncharacterized protein LOC132043904 n=1 Tax=Lycium ferocissimum TaxID=112874 RepID=UPI0028158C5A|nr:uncharacterized protein LOC132043904 [Lycium ferocissimum]
MGELTTGRGLHQELGLIRSGDTRWGSHYKSFCNFILMFASIIDVLDACSPDESAKDIANAMLLVKVAKRMLQSLREDAWDALIDKVSTFCIKYNILIPNFEEPYVNSGRSWRKPADHTVLHHYRYYMFYKIIDWQLQELSDRFNEVTTDLLHGVACLNPIDSYSSFNIRKIMRMAENYILMTLMNLVWVLLRISLRHTLLMSVILMKGLPRKLVLKKTSSEALKLSSRIPLSESFLLARLASVERGVFGNEVY